MGELLDLAEAMRDLADRATTAEGQPGLDDLVDLAVEGVPSARWASLAVLQGRTFRTQAGTDDRATQADVLQYDMGFGPCVDGVLDIYADTAGAFDEHARAIGLVLATHGGLVMNTMLANDRVRNLERALESNRETGVAIGVLRTTTCSARRRHATSCGQPARTPTASPRTSRSRSSRPAP